MTLDIRFAMFRNLRDSLNHDSSCGILTSVGPYLEKQSCVARMKNHIVVQRLKQMGSVINFHSLNNTTP